MITENLKYFAGLLFIMSLVSDVSAKEWRGIIPLKSTKADIERLLGEPNQLGRYELQDERVSIMYSEGPCEGTFQGLARVNCECLVAIDTVLKIAVTLDSPVKISKLGIDKKKYERTPFHAYQATATYSDLREGVVYTIRESDDRVIGIDYLPSAKDCEQIVGSRGVATLPNVWHEIAPWRSTRIDVERLLGPAESWIGNIYTYRTKDERVDVFYTEDPCKGGETKLRVTPNNFVLKLLVSPQRPMLVHNLQLDKTKYRRIQSDHPENSVHYLNSEEGITVDATLNDGCEQVVSIIYQATTKARESRCRSD